MNCRKAIQFMVKPIHDNDGCQFIKSALQREMKSIVS